MAAEQLENCHPTVDFGFLSLFELSVDLPVQVAPNTQRVFSFQGTRNYVGNWRLHPDGRLQLITVRFASKDGTADTILSVQGCFVPGDFNIKLRPFARGPCTEVPFRRGRIVTDENSWQREDQSFVVQVESARSYGLQTDLGFIPKSALPIALQKDLHAAVGQTLRCKVLEIRGRNITLLPVDSGYTSETR